ncbi:MAG: hypothetical protein LBP98_07045 [Tannerella sp.]|jgi:hypothetical protein|nr:hypothetical protein [Tannerella sp.]
MANIPWVIVDVMPRMMVKIARALAGGAGVSLKKFRVGYGWITGTAPNFTLQTPPADANAVPGQFYEGNLSSSTLAADGAKVITKCVIPIAAVGEPKQMSAIVLVDNENQVIGAGSFLPGWVVPDGEFEIDCVLELQYARGNN